MDSVCYDDGLRAHSRAFYDIQHCCFSVIFVIVVVKYFVVFFHSYASNTFSVLIVAIFTTAYLYRYLIYTFTSTGHHTNKHTYSRIKLRFRWQSVSQLFCYSIEFVVCLFPCCRRFSYLSSIIQVRFGLAIHAIALSKKKIRNKLHEVKNRITKI